MSKTSVSPKYAWVVAGAGFLTQIIACWGVQIFGMTLGSISEDLGVEQTSIAIAASLFGLFYAGFSVLAGNLADKIGIRKVMGVGSLIASVILLATGMLATGPVSVIVGYSAFGVFLASIGAGVTPKLVGTWFSNHTRGKGFALCIVGGSLGGVMMGVIAPIFITAGGWRLCFEAIGGIGIVVAILSFLLIRDSPAAMGTVPFGSDKEEAAVVDQSVVDEAARTESSVARIKRLFKMPNLWKMIVVYVAFQLYYMMHQTYFVSALTSAGYSITVAGLVSSLLYVGICIGQVVFPSLSDKFARKNILGVLMVAASALYLCVYPVLTWETPATIVFVLAFFVGIIIAANAMLQTVMTELFPPDLRGAGPGMVSTFGLIGRFGGPILGGWFIASMAGGNMLAYPILAAPIALIGGLVALITLPKTGGKYGDPLAENYMRENVEG